MDDSRLAQPPELAGGSNPTPTQRTAARATMLCIFARRSAAHRRETERGRPFHKAAGLQRGLGKLPR
eukprot:742688-Pyramimonas_sp.AAC.1